VGYFTEEQIKQKIETISSAIDIVLSGGKSYRLNDTQGDVQVTRESLPNLQNALNYWVSKYNEIADSNSGIISLGSSR